MEANGMKQQDEGTVRYREPYKPSGVLIIIAVLLVLAGIVLSQSMVITEQDEYTLIRQFGKVDHIISEPGLTFKIPFMQTSETLPKKILVTDLPASDVITMDKKTMVADRYVLWRVSDPLKFVQTLNSQISNAEARISTTVYNSIKNVISSMSQNEVISGREGRLSDTIMENIGDTMDGYGIELLSVETKRLDLPSDNKQAVYERMISERNNIAASYTAEGESEAMKIRTATDNEISVNISAAEAEAEKLIAEGEAEYMRILSAAYADEDRADFYTFVRALDAAKIALSGENKTLILSSDSPLVQIFNNVE